MLLQKHVHKIDKFARLFEAREQKVLLQFFVIIFNKLADDFSRISERFGRQVLVRVHATKRFAVNEQDAFQHAVLAHEIFRRRDLFIFRCLLFSEQARSAAKR